MSNMARRGRSAIQNNKFNNGPGGFNQRQNAPPLNTNFIAGGKLGMPQGVQQQPMQIPVRNVALLQQDTLPQMAAHPQQQPQQQPPRLVFKQETPMTPQKVQQLSVLKMEVPSTPAQISSTAEGDGADTNGTSENSKSKPDWITIRGGRISKKERRQRRNQRLARLLQPKNGLMVLNELIGAHTFEFSEAPGPHNEVAFKATIKVEGKDVCGFGKTKTAAKNYAAEEALKAFVLSKLVNPQSSWQAAAPATTVVVPTPMTVDGIEEATEQDLSWSHLASFALHKLLNSWDDAGNLVERILANSAHAAGGVVVPLAEGNPDPATTTTTTTPKGGTKKPAKSLPANAEDMNPVMLMNQMRPGTTYEEVQKTGNPPHTQYLMRTVIEGQEFYGRGTNKKAARTQCAFEACNKILGVAYRAGTFEPVRNMETG